MKISVVRNPISHDGAVLGSLFINGTFECFTLERESRMIPEGTYPVDIRYSPHFERSLPHIEPVPGRSEIMIHPLNWAFESEGCIGVGQEHSVTSIEHSVLAMQHLQPQIAKAIALKETVTIEITSKPAPLEA